MPAKNVHAFSTGRFSARFLPSSFLDYEAYYHRCCPPLHLPPAAPLLVALVMITFLLLPSISFFNLTTCYSFQKFNLKRAFFNIWIDSHRERIYRYSATENMKATKKLFFWRWCGQWIRFEINRKWRTYLFIYIKIMFETVQYQYTSISGTELDI